MIKYIGYIKDIGIYREIEENILGNFLSFQAMWKQEWGWLVVACIFNPSIDIKNAEIIGVEDVALC